MLKWLEPAIEQRVLEVVDACEEQTNELYVELTSLLEQLRLKAPESSEILSKIENIFILKTNIITKNSYKAGFDDGLYIGKRMR